VTIQAANAAPSSHAAVNAGRGSERTGEDLTGGRDDRWVVLRGLNLVSVAYVRE
jgi:hypothetical protein